VHSQARFHGLDPNQTIVEAKPRDGETHLRTEDLVTLIKSQGSELALVLLGNVNYLTGQAFDVPKIAEAARSVGCFIGIDLAHGVGNLKLSLHDWGVDFAVWCGYKYLNSGPGAIAGAFIHERHLGLKDIPRFEGWWGHDKSTRFKMGPQFVPIPTAEAWQLSNPPIFQLAAHRASLELFDQATMNALRAKSEALTGYLEELLNTLPTQLIQSLTPVDPSQRGCQISMRVIGSGKDLQQKLFNDGVICDFREPDVVRVAPVPLYNQFADVLRFVEVLSRHV
jgi:kynureninase